MAVDQPFSASDFIVRKAHHQLDPLANVMVVIDCALYYGIWTVTYKNAASADTREFFDTANNFRHATELEIARTITRRIRA